MTTFGKRIACSFTCLVLLATSGSTRPSCVAQDTIPTTPSQASLETSPKKVGPIWRTVDRRRTPNSEVEVRRVQFESGGLKLDGLKLGDRPLNRFARLSNQDGKSPRQIDAQWPIRIITLWTGERFVAQLIGTNNSKWAAPAKSKQLELMLGKNRISIEWPLVREISMPRQIREFGFDPQQPQLGGWTQGRDERPLTRGSLVRSYRGTNTISKGLATFRSQSPMSTGEISMNLLWRRIAFKPQTKPGVSEPGNQVLHFVFDGPQPDSYRVLSVKNGADGLLIVEAPDEHRMTTSNVRFKSDLLKIRFRFGTQNQLSINGQIAARSSQRIGMFRYARILVDDTPVGCGMTTLCERLSADDSKAVPKLLLSPSSDRIVLHSGGELFGIIRKVTPSTVELEASKSKIVIEWRRIRSIQMYHSATASAAKLKPIAGDLARVKLRQIPGIDQGGTTSLLLTLQSADVSGLVADHPLLGTIKFNWRDLHAIEPLGRCDLYQILRMTPIHLGESTRLDFQLPKPGGTTTKVEFSLPKLAVKQVQLQLQIADLEPSGLETLAARPRRDELRSGHFTTEVWVNDKFNCALNGFVSRLSAPDAPFRIELTISPENLIEGVNRVVIKQKPSLTNSADYDDCEIGSIALLIKR